MPHDGAITFRDIVGKLAILRMTCDKCGRSGQYRVDRLILRYGIDAKLFTWSDEPEADCPRRHSKNLYDQCGARCPDWALKPPSSMRCKPEHHQGRNEEGSVIEPIPDAVSGP